MSRETVDNLGESRTESIKPTEDSNEGTLKMNTAAAQVGVKGFFADVIKVDHAAIRKDPYGIARDPNNRNFHAAQEYLDMVKRADPAEYARGMREFEARKNREQEDFAREQRRAEEVILGVLTELFDFRSPAELPGFLRQFDNEETGMVEIDPKNITIEDLLKKLKDHSATYKKEELVKLRGEYDPLSKQVDFDYTPERGEDEDIETWRERVKQLKIDQKNRARTLQNSIHKIEQEIDHIERFTKKLETFVIDTQYTVEEYLQKTQNKIEMYNQHIAFKKAEKAGEVEQFAKPPNA